MERIKKIENFLWIRYQIFDNPALNGSDIMVYAALMRYMNNETRECYPSISTLSQKARLNKDTIYKSLEKLEKEKLIYRQRGRGRNNKYIILEPPQTSRIFPTSRKRGKA